MNNPFYRAPHVAGPNPSGTERAGNAALLIDFDNVTMGIRSDLSRELRALLDADVIRGKVTVQRAYADWRRYPQYIVPLSEASIDLIFAPAYGSSKKNATDIRLAIDALELVFIRPEIRTFILLSGDSDFSSLVLKLKEYGKFVIGVGLQESSSDILVQNCDEYYSYNTLTGLTKTDEAERVEFDPWVLVEKAVDRMVERRDVMRSDRLKQVMVEIDPNFEERKFGFARFSKFLAEAAGKGLLVLKKLDNGQFEVSPGKKRRTGKRTRRSAKVSRSKTSTDASPASTGAGTAASLGGEPPEEDDDRPETLDRAYSLMRAALEELREAGRDPARDSDVKRRLLKLRPSFDEAELGFPKFSKFLKKAAEDHIVRIERLENGQFEVSLPGGRRRSRSSSSEKRESRRGRRKDGAEKKNGGRKRSPRSESRRGGSEDEPKAAKRADVPENGRESAKAADAQAGAPARSKTRTPRSDPEKRPEKRPEQEPAPATPPASAEPAVAEKASEPASSVVSEVTGGGLLPRAQKRGRGADGPPPIMEGQAINVAKLIEKADEPSG